MNLERIRYVNTNRKSQVTDRTELRERRNVGVLNVCVCLFSAGFYAKWLNVMRRIIIWWMFVWDSGHSDLHTHIRWFLSLKVTGPCGPEVVVCYNVCVCVCLWTWCFGDCHECQEEPAEGFQMNPHTVISSFFLTQTQTTCFCCRRTGSRTIVAGNLLGAHPLAAVNCNHW